MTALFAIITFFFIFVLVYSSITAVMAVVTWGLMRQAAGKDEGRKKKDIEHRMDLIKDRVFIIALVLTFFIVTPFAVLYVFVIPG